MRSKAQHIKMAGFVSISAIYLFAVSEYDKHHYHPLSASMGVLQFISSILLVASAFAVSRSYRAVRRSTERQEQTLERLPYSYFSLDADWRFTYVNAEAERMLGKSKQDLLGKNIWLVYPDAVGSVYQHAYVRALVEKQAVVLETRNATSGEWCELRAHPSEGGVEVFLQSVTAAKRAEEDLREACLIADSIAEHLSSLIFVYDLHARRNSYINRGVREFLGYQAESIQEKRAHYLLDLIHPDDLDLVAQHIRTFDDLTDQSVAELEVRARRSSGEWCWIRICEKIFKRDADGRPTHVLGVAWDVTARREAGKEIDRQRQFLEAILEEVQAGIVACDAQGAITLFNRATREFHGFIEPPLLATEWAEQHGLYQSDGKTPVHPQHVPLLQALRGESVRDVELVIAPQSLPARTLLANGQALRDSSGAIIGAVMVMHDVTERKLAENMLTQLHRQNQMLLNSIGEGIFGIDPDGRASVVNPAAASMLGYEASEMIGCNLHDLVHHSRPDGSPFPIDACPIYAPLREGGARRTTELVFWRKDGSPLPVECASTPIMAEGRILGLVVSFTDITERTQHARQIELANRSLEEANSNLEKQIDQINEQSVELEVQKAELESANVRLEAMNAQLEMLATTDGMTGLKNHRLFHERLQDEFDRATRYRSELSVIFLDADKFKDFNDTYGHPAGDTVLREVGVVLQATARQTDTVARYGGEEFAIILSETNEAEARMAAERFRLAIQEFPWTHPPITASFGVSTRTSETRDAMALVEEADRALYRSKQHGRNRVTHATDSDVG